MAFGKQDYKLKRKRGQRGQGDYPKETFYPKGEWVTTTNREGEEVEWPNAKGKHLIRVQGRGLTYVSRKEARAVTRDRTASKTNYAYQHEKNGFKHVVGKKNTPLRRIPGISNHTAHRERQLMREAERLQRAKV